MSVSKLDNLEFCKLWLSAIKPFADVSYQKRVWFRFEGEEVDSYEDSIEVILDVAERNLIPKFESYLTPQCQSYIRELTSKVDHFRHSPSYYMSATEEKLFADPDWKEIVSVAQKAYQALEAFKKELENG